MPCGVLTSPITKHLATNFSGADSLRFEAFTEWFPAMGMDYVKAIPQAEVAHTAIPVSARRTDCCRQNLRPRLLDDT